MFTSSSRTTLQLSFEGIAGGGGGGVILTYKMAKAMMKERIEREDEDEDKGGWEGVSWLEKVRS